jgi:hypothetical protein
MKRTLSVATLLGLVATVASATSVTSVNTVGYQTLSIKGGTYNMLAVNWDEVGGASKSIQDLFDTSTLTGSSAFGSADNIKVWDPDTSNYTTYFLYDSGGTYPSWDGKWVTTSYIYSDSEFANGASFWLLTRGGDTSLTIDGQVPVEATVAKTLKAGTFTMIGSAFAADLPLNDGLDVAGNGSSAFGSADNVKVWDPDTSNYTTYFLYDSGGTYPSWDGKWVTTAYIYTSDAIAMGKGAWYLNRGGSDITWTESKPY